MKLSAEKSTDLARRISHIYNQVKDNQNAIQLKRKVMKYMDPLEKLGLEDVDEETITKKDCVIQIKLFQSLNGGYVVRFVRKGGEIEDYHKKLDRIISIVKEVA